MKFIPADDRASCGMKNTFFWEQIVEINYSAARREFEDDEFARRWIHGLSHRVRSVLLVWLGHHPAIEVHAARELLFDARAWLLPFRLTELAIAGRRTRSIEQVARGRLPSGEVDACLIQEPKTFDRLALAAKLCAVDYNHLADAHYFDKAHTQGFTLLRPRALPSTYHFARTEFFQRSLIQDILTEYEFGRGGERVSTCASLMHMRQTGRYMAFIKRENAPAKISVDGATTFGFIPEWIVLDVDAEAKDVRLAASSADASVEIAEMILRVYVGAPVVLEETPSTSQRSNVEEFVNALVDGAAEDYKLRDITVRVHGGQVMLQVEEGVSSTLLCSRAETGFGTAIRGLENIRSLGIRVRDRSVKVKLEFLANEPDHVVVRYSDQNLDVGERRWLEAGVQAEWGVRLQSLERKRARRPA